MVATLPRRLGLWSAIAVVIGSTIGSGIFRSPAGIADRLPGPLPLLAVWATVAVLGVVAAGAPVYWLTVGRAATD